VRRLTTKGAEAMTDEPDKAGKPVKATFILFALLLSALAFLAGDKARSPKTGYLHINHDSVTFVEWAQAWDKLEGTIKTLDSKPDGEVVTTVFMFNGLLRDTYGALYDAEVDLTLTSSGNAQDGFYPYPIDKTIRGVLRGDTLAWQGVTLVLPHMNKVDALGMERFRRATPAEFDEASRKLQMRAKLNKGAK
jgi:hypothetical protein